jgi:hypothetical protein
MLLGKNINTIKNTEKIKYNLMCNRQIVVQTHSIQVANKLFLKVQIFGINRNKSKLYAQRN